IAAKNPAAPPPTIAICSATLWSGVSALAEDLSQFPGVLNRESISIVVEIDPCFAGVARLYLPGQLLELFHRVVVTIPLASSMQARIEYVARPNQVIRQTRRADCAEDKPAVSKAPIHRLAPPALMPEFNGVPVLRVELTDDACQS